MLHAQVIVDVLEKLDVRAGFVRRSWRRIHPHLQNIGDYETVAIARLQDFGIPLAR